MNRFDIRAAILGSDDLAREPIDVPWDLGDEKLYVRALTTNEKDEYYAMTMPTGEFRWTTRLQASLLVKVIVNEAGERIFDDADAEALGQKSAAALSKVFDATMRLSGMNDEGAAEIEAGFTKAQNDGSVSG
jgi:hypothetical protein